MSTSNPDIFDSYLVVRGFSDDSLLVFWHKFLFPRKIQLKEPKSALVYSLQNNSIVDFSPQQFNLWFTQNELENKLPEKDETQSRVKKKI